MVVVTSLTIVIAVCWVSIRMYFSNEKEDRIQEAVGAAELAAALDDTYRFDDFGMSLKISKNYYVITRETPASDEAYSVLKLNYNDTVKAFEAADIYLRAYDPEGTFQISLTITSDERSKAINNYTELSDAERRNILDVLTAEPGVTSAAEVKHGGWVYYDTSRESTLDGEPLYINQCNTVVNGLQIDLSMQKGKEAILANETKVLTTIAASVEFDNVKTTDTGPVFSWWRILLWAGILVVLTVGVSVVYKHRNAAKRRRLEERRLRRSAAQDEADITADVITVDDKPVTFEEVLGYRDADRYSSRAATDLDTFDISVKEKSPTHGISYFEDEGKSIDDRADDYFDSYFRGPTPRRSGIARLFSTIGAYIGIGFRHIGYFFRNLFRRKPKQK